MLVVWVGEDKGHGPTYVSIHLNPAFSRKIRSPYRFRRLPGMSEANRAPVNRLVRAAS
jgi:hypothetical protein